MAKCRIGTAKFFTLLLLLYRTSAKSQGMKQLMAGGGVALIGMLLVPQLTGLFGYSVTPKPQPLPSCAGGAERRVNPYGFSVGCHNRMAQGASGGRYHEQPVRDVRFRQPEGG